MEITSVIGRWFVMMAILLVIVNMTLFMPKVSARYLPTRSNDQLRRQEIKEILRLLLDLPADENSQKDSQIGWSNNRDAYESIRLTRNIQQPGPELGINGMVTNQRSKRSTLLKSFSINDQ